MHLVSKSKILHRREYSAKRIQYLCHGRYLPVEVPPIDTYAKDIRLGPKEIQYYFNSLVNEIEPGNVESQVLCCVHKLHEMWNRKRELLEEVELQLFETRGGDPTNNRFQISANALELKQAKVRKCNGCRDWRMRELPLHIAIGNRECKSDCERL